MSSSYPATVVKVIDQYRIVINRGARDGIESAQRFLIWLQGEKITDPDTGEDLGTVEVVRGTGRAVHVQEKMTTIESDKYSNPAITKTRRSNPVFAFGQELIEERGEPQQLPFDEVAVGDKARPV